VSARDSHCGAAGVCFENLASSGEFHCLRLHKFCFFPVLIDLMETVLHELKVKVLECFSAFLDVRDVINYAVFDSQFLVLVFSGVRWPALSPYWAAGLDDLAGSPG
jgi:hypothetical protein